MLPPPITMAISTPRWWTSITSSAIWASVCGSMPYPTLPIRASPLSLSRMRRYLTPGAKGGLGGSSPPPREVTAAADGGAPFCGFAAATIALRLTRLSFHFLDEVVRAPVQPLAHLEAGEAPHAHVLTRLGDEVGLQVADGLLALGVLDPRLLEQTDVLVPLGDLPIDDLRPD